MAPRCMHSAALVASFTAVSMRIASSGSISRASGTRSTPLVPGMRMSHNISAMRWRLSCCKASSPEPAAYTSNCCWVRNFLRAFRIGSSSSTTRIWTGPAMSATLRLLRRFPSENGAARSVWIAPAAGRVSGGGDEREIDEAGNQAGAMRPGEELAERAAADRSVVDGVGIHVHPDEAISAGVVEAAAIGLGVREGLGAMREPVLNAGLEVAGDGTHQGWP